MTWGDFRRYVRGNFLQKIIYCILVRGFGLLVILGKFLANLIGWDTDRIIEMSLETY